MNDYSCRKLDVVMVGTLPPHMSGTARINKQIATGFSEMFGYRVRAIASSYEESEESDINFLKNHGIEIRRTSFP